MWHFKYFYVCKLEKDTKTSIEISKQIIEAYKIKKPAKLLWSFLIKETRLNFSDYETKTKTAFLKVTFQKKQTI